MYEIIGCLILAVTLVVLSVMDIIKREIPVWIAGAAVIFRIVYLIIDNNYNELLWSAAVGIIAVVVGILISHVTRGAVGEGDAWICGTIIMCMGCIDGITAIITAFLFAAVYSALLMIFKKVSRKFSIPFVPFLASGYLFTTGWMFLTQ